MILLRRPYRLITSNLPGRAWLAAADKTSYRLYVVKKSLEAFRTVLVNPAWLCFTWFGMTAGISLIASPARFTAPSLDRAVALDVGRVVFAALNKAELIALILLLILVRVSGRAKKYWAPCGALAAILILQSAWLLPELAERSQQILAGSEPAPSMAHATYAVLEIGKLLILLYTGFVAMRGDRA